MSDNDGDMPRSLKLIAGISTAISLVAGIVSLKACNEAEKARLDVVESQAKVQGRLKPTLDFFQLEHQLGGRDADYNVYASVAANSDGAQPIAIEAIEYSLWACDYVKETKQGKEPVALRVGVPPPLGPTPASPGVEEISPSGCWKQLDRVSFPFPASPMSCDASTGMPTSKCQLNGVGIYSQGESFASSSVWRMSLPRASTITLIITIQWCKFESQQRLDEARAGDLHLPMTSVLASSICIPQTPWTLSKVLLLCGRDNYQTDCPTTSVGNSLVARPPVPRQP